MARHKEKFYTIKGYFTSPLLYSDMVDKYPDGSIFVEVGVYRGKSLYYLWLPKVKKGGIISGHDYIYDDNAVKKVVDELFGDRMNKEYLPENCWMVEI